MIKRNFRFLSCFFDKIKNSKNSQFYGVVQSFETDNFVEATMENEILLKRFKKNFSLEGDYSIFNF